MNTIQIVGAVLLLITSILMIVLVLSQNSKSDGMNAMSGKSSDSYLSKNRGKTLDSKLVNITRIVLVVFFVLAIAMNLIITYVK